jgi:hypothetical protein
MREEERLRLINDAVVAYGSVPAAIESLKRLREHGVIAFTPPICGFLVRAGILLDLSKIEDVLSELTEVDS